MLDAGGPYFKFVDPGGVNGIPSPLFPAHWGSLDEYWFLFLVVKHNPLAGIHLQFFRELRYGMDDHATVTQSFDHGIFLFFFQTQDFHGKNMESLSCSMRKSRGVPAMAMAGGRAWNDLPPRPPPPEDWGVDQWISRPKVGEILGFNHLTNKKWWLNIV